MFRKCFEDFNYFKTPRKKKHLSISRFLKTLRKIEKSKIETQLEDFVKYKISAKAFKKV